MTNPQDDRSDAGVARSDPAAPPAKESGPAVPHGPAVHAGPVSAQPSAGTRGLVAEGTGAGLSSRWKRKIITVGVVAVILAGAGYFVAPMVK
jgi:hypothetical protein